MHLDRIQRLNRRALSPKLAALVACVILLAGGIARAEPISIDAIAVVVGDSIDVGPHLQHGRL